MAMLSKKQVVERTGLSATTIWRQVRAGKFPNPRQLTPNRIGWPEHEVQKWEESRLVGHCKVSINFKKEVA